jgi:hypothetical protein
MSPHRYMNFITAEGAYWDLYRRAPDTWLQTARLLLRALRQRFRYRDSAYSRITFRHFLHRVFWKKQDRLRAWKQQSAQRNLPAVSLGKVVG